MTARSSNLSTLLMSLEILRRIPRSGKISASELQSQLAAGGFVRELRTVQRQLEALSEHFGIDRDDRSRPYGYSWKPRSQGFASSHISEPEAVLLTLAQQQLSHLLPTALARSMESFFLQARGQLEAPAGDGPGKGRNWLDKVRVVSTSQPLLPPPLATGIFEAVSNALYADRWLDVDYVNVNGRRNCSRVMPLGLAQQGSCLFLVCRFEGYDDERSLALHRMRRATDSGQVFVRPPEFNLRRFDEDGRFGFGDGKRIRLEFSLPDLSAQHLLESKLSADQTSKPLRGGRTLISATVVASDQLRWWLRGFGDQLRLIRPRGFVL